MTQDDVQIIKDVYFRKYKSTSLSFSRYLISQINWDARLIGIKGMRGVGKTTLMLQRIKSCFRNPNDAFYASLDNMWFQTHRLQDLIEFLYTHGIRHLFLDEVHKYPQWPQAVKDAYDTFDDLYIVYAGSSMLEIDNSKVDLSRRQTLYTLRGMSFREYLHFTGTLDYDAIPLEEILSNHLRHELDITSGKSILPLFENYQRIGYYPFSKDAGKDYAIRLNEVASLVIEGDLPAVEEVSYATILKAKRLLMVIAQNVPLVPNISKLCGQLECTRDLCLKLLYLLDRAGMLALLTKSTKDYKHLVSPEKIYLDNNNLMFAISPKNNVGTLRETFFLNQLQAVSDVTMPKVGDFCVDGRYLFEVGGKGKTFDQIADQPDSYLAVDDIELGSGNRIPLWIFGFLY